MTRPQPGEIWTQTIRHTGKPDRERFIRIRKSMYPDPDWIDVDHCDAAGFVIDGTGRCLRTSTITSRYRFHYSPEREDTA